MHIRERFEQKFIKRDSGCWKWVASISTGKYGGYGSFRFKGKMCRAHRISWILYRGPIPPNMDILHRCNNKKCVNPEHLYVGTQYENVQDSYMPNRRPGAKLKEYDIVCIKKMLRDRIPQWLIAWVFRVDRTAVSHINTETAWPAVNI